MDEISTVITKTQPVVKPSQKTTPLIAAETKDFARNTRKTTNPLWLKVFIPQQCLAIFFVDA